VVQTNFRSVPPDPDFENGVEPVDGLGDGRPDATEVVTVDFADDRVGRPGVDGSDLGRRRPRGDVVPITLRWIGTPEASSGR